MTGPSAGRDMGLVGLVQGFTREEYAKGVGAEVGADEELAGGVEEDSMGMGSFLTVSLGAGGFQRSRLAEKGS